MIPAKLQRLEEKLQTWRIEAVALNAGASLTYLTGLDFHLMERPVVLLHRVGSTPLLILPELEAAKLDHLDYPIDTCFYSDNPDQWPQVFKQAIASLHLLETQIGIEPGQLRLLEYHLLRTVLSESAFTDGSGILAALRSIKDAEELALLEKAVAIAERALQATLLQARVGISEYEFASELVMQLLRHGSETNLPFTPIVASGPNGATPHARPGERRLTSGDLLVVDWGARWHGYAADLTRTFGVGHVAQQEQEIHAIVRQANRAGRTAGRPELTCAMIDEATRSVIKEAGYGAHFTHRTGHGIGLECHESPYIHAGNQQLLQPGMTFTVEPGIYLHNQNGVRIEDDVVITESGCRSLSSFSRELIYIS
ncbi:M24 family metallopeptidase [Desulfofustis glycolicus]|uniref:Xaa-Pro dipeptidase n=1 Tax=Desulfofustis glycolicus DSM 9705 TaxID=1121409 RepID=A0A1M5V0M7_9BACT|nr:Xaa-Pro peptidase family protein [Desulfofustis glycolicus]MCB2215987.1 Xaa-Pro peptidase family protein [Desulfobulbaceae bacterium]SHH68684.1 Xaa-Pro dipeptidase [Desulfofustis glycolicus DSM 9705]